MPNWITNSGRLLQRRSAPPAGDAGLALQQNIDSVDPWIMSRAPTANDDGANTGGAGATTVTQLWIDTAATPHGVYICASSATAAAVWDQIYPPLASAMAEATDSAPGTLSAADKTKLDGLGTASTHAATDFDVAGAAATAQSNAEAYAASAASAAQSAAESASIPATYLDTDGTMAANSDAKVPSQKAVVSYVAANAGGASLPIALPAGGPYVFQVDTSGNVACNTISSDNDLIQSNGYGALAVGSLTINNASYPIYIYGAATIFTSGIADSYAQSAINTLCALFGIPTD
jgi:hypothetical protein